MPPELHAVLTRRERQIMDFLYSRGRATAAEVMAVLPGGPAYSTVRTQLRLLEQKGHLHHEEDSLRFVYFPAVPRHTVGKSALHHLIETFFEGSAERLVEALLRTRLPEGELDRLAERIAKARKEVSR